MKGGDKDGGKEEPLWLRLYTAEGEREQSHKKEEEGSEEI